jgi:hypothetical protein
MFHKNKLIDEKYLQQRLSQIYKCKVKLLSIHRIESNGIKKEGPSIPFLLEFKTSRGKKRVILKIINPIGYGISDIADRAALLIWKFLTYKKLPKHSKSLDIGVKFKDGRFFSFSNMSDFFMIEEYAEGEEYIHDLNAIFKKKEINSLDKLRAQALAKYLASIHRNKRKDKQKYQEAIQYLITRCISLIDEHYNNNSVFNVNDLKTIEKKIIEWHQLLRNKYHRLCQIHGDFNPWNIKFTGKNDIRVLDRSKPEWGEAALDLSFCLNYIFFSLQKYGKLTDGYEVLFNTFLSSYLKETNDIEILSIIQPFVAGLALVLTNSTWYPTVNKLVRKKLRNFVLNVLSVDVFEVHNVNLYLEQNIT